jgi:hypothetical protein
LTGGRLRPPGLNWSSIAGARNLRKSGTIARQGMVRLWQSRWPGWLLRFVHHALLAAVISALVLLLEFNAYFHGLDQNLLFEFNTRLSQQDIEDSGRRPEHVRLAISSDEYPQVLEIDTQLARSKSSLADLVTTVSQERPSVIAIGLDVSPSRFDAPISYYVPVQGSAPIVQPSETPLPPPPPIVEGIDGDAQISADREAMIAKREQEIIDEILKLQAVLDTALDTAATAGIRVIVMVPQIMFTEDAGYIDSTTGRIDPYRQIAFDWMHARCDAKVHFAVSETWRDLTQIASQFWPEEPTLGVLAARSATGSARFDACQITARAGRDRDRFYQIWMAEVPRIGEMSDRPLSSVFFAAQSQIRSVHRAPGTPLHPGETVEGLADLRPGAVVFIGDSFHGVKTFVKREISWVQLYAAEAFSMDRGIESLSNGYALLGDTVLGICLGYLFAFLWGRYAVAAGRLEATPLRPVSDKIATYASARVWLVVNICTLPLVLYAMLAVSGWLLARSLWLNPIPVAAAMFLDALLRSRRKATEPAITTPPELLDRHPDIPLQLVFLAGVLIFVFLIYPTLS